MILLGHTNILKRNTIWKSLKKIIVKLHYGMKIILLIMVQIGGNNLDLIEQNHDLIDKYFITTHPSVIKTKINKSKIKLFTNTC